MKGSTVHPASARSLVSSTSADTSRPTRGTTIASSALKILRASVPSKWYVRTHWETANILNVIQHKKSFAHKPRDIACPCGCDKAFKLRSSVLAHLASGQCANSPGVGRREVNASACSAGIPGVIPNPTGGTYERNWPTVASERSYNSAKRAYECFLCEKEFRLLDSLNQHLTSGAHERAQYRLVVAYE